MSKPANMLQLFNVGDTIYGYCNGFFGRDSYEDKVCVMVRPKYAVFETEDGHAEVLNFTSFFQECVVETNEWKEWKQPPE